MTTEPDDDALFAALTDPGEMPQVPELDFAAARKIGADETLEAVATWLEECVRCVQLGWRAELAADLRTGQWRRQPRLKGLREGDLLRARARALRDHHVPVNEWPAGVREAAMQRGRSQEQQREEEIAETARILVRDHGMDPQTAEDAARKNAEASARW